MPLGEKPIYEFGPFRVDASQRLLQRDGELIPLAPKAFDTLLALVEAADQVLLKEDLLKRVWPDTFVEEGSLAQNISLLRKVLGETGNGQPYIQTIPKRGYRLASWRSREHPSRRFQRTIPLTEPGTFLDSVAVLPFENVATDSETEYLSDGIAETILNSLSQLERVRVVPRATVFRFKGRTAESVQIGRQLGVRLVLIGRVMVRGNDLIVGAELIEVNAESQIWGCKYKRKLDDIFALQEEIAREIAGKLLLHLDDEDRKRLARRPTENRLAYHLFLKALHQLNRWTPEGFRKAIEYFWKAIEEDPSYTDSYAGLAFVYIGLGMMGQMRSADGLHKARAAAQRALERDEPSGFALAAVGMVKVLYEWDWNGARQQIERAVRVAPNDPYCRICLGFWFVVMGKYEEGIAQMRAALDLDPLSAIISHHLAFAYHQAGYEYEAIQQFLNTIELNPWFAEPYEQLALAYAKKGMHEHAFKYMEKYLTLTGQANFESVLLARVYAISGKRKEAIRSLEELKKNLPSYAVASLAFVYAALGDSEQTFACLEKAYEQREVFLLLLPADNEFRHLHEDPRFSSLLDRIGLPAARTV
jgi:adenylate cyclase